LTWRDHIPDSWHQLGSFHTWMSATNSQTQCRQLYGRKCQLWRWTWRSVTCEWWRSSLTLGLPSAIPLGRAVYCMHRSQNPNGAYHPSWWEESHYTRYSPMTPQAPWEFLCCHHMLSPCPAWARWKMSKSGQTDVRKYLFEHVFWLFMVKIRQFLVNPQQYLNQFNVATLKAVLSIPFHKQIWEYEQGYYLLWSGVTVFIIFTVPVIFGDQILYGRIEDHHTANCSSLWNIIGHFPGDNETLKLLLVIKKWCMYLCFVALSCFRSSTSSIRAAIFHFALAWGDVWTQSDVSKGGAFLDNIPEMKQG
jgi:hypothetical protein